MTVEARPRLWVVSELFYPEETSTGHVMTQIALWMASRFEVGVVCAQPTYAARGRRSPSRESLGGVQVLRVPSTTFSKDRVVLRLVNVATITVSTFMTLVRRLKPGDVVLVVTNPPTSPYVAAIAARIRRARVAVLIHDMYPEVLAVTSTLRPDGRVYRVLDRMSRWLLRNADALIFCGRDQRARARRKVEPAMQDDFDRRSVVVTNWADVDDVVPGPREESEYWDSTWDQKTVVQFAGNIGRLQGIPGLVDALELLHERDDLHIVFFGDGAMAGWLRQEVADRELAGLITLRDRVGRTEASAMHQACDIALLSLSSGMEGVSVPSRTYNILASGRPLVAVCSTESEVGKTIGEHGLGWVVSPCDAQGLASALAAAAADRRQLASMGARARAVAEGAYSKTKVLMRLEDALRQLVEERC